MTKTIVVSRWEKDGYQNKTDETYAKFHEIQEVCKKHNLDEPVLEFYIHSWGETYAIFADEKITDFVNPVYINDFEPLFDGE